LAIKILLDAASLRTLTTAVGTGFTVVVVFDQRCSVPVPVRLNPELMIRRFYVAELVEFYLAYLVGRHNVGQRSLAEIMDDFGCPSSFSLS